MYKVVSIRCIFAYDFWQDEPLLKPRIDLYLIRGIRRKKLPFFHGELTVTLKRRLSLKWPSKWIVTDEESMDLDFYAMYELMFGL